MGSEYSHTYAELKKSTSDLVNWFDTPLGQAVLELDNARLSRLLPDMFGYHILQVGNFLKPDLLVTSRINHKLVSSLIPSENSGKNPDLICMNSALPIESESMDVVLLPHVLEFEDQPHQLLREAQRVLIGEGHVVIIGFNPISLWGLWRLFLNWREYPPWHGHYINIVRLKDWLSLLDFEVVRLERFFFRPPLKNMNVMKRLNIMEQLGQYCWTIFGGIYLLVAKKRVVSMTPIRLQWQSRRQLVSSGLIEPSA